MHNIFLNKLSFRCCPEIPCGYCVCYYLPVAQGDNTILSILSTNHRTVCVAQTCWHPFRHISTPTKEYCEMSTAHHSSVRTPPTFGSGNMNCAAPLHTEPTRTRRWKRAIKQSTFFRTHKQTFFIMFPRKL